MLTHFHLSDSAFERMVRRRLLEEFQPIDEPISYNGQPCYMDGFRIGSVSFGQSDRPFPFTLNDTKPRGLVGPATAAVNRLPVVVRINGALMLSSAASVKGARTAAPDSRYGMPDRPESLNIPIFGAELDVFFTVSDRGEPLLNMPLRKVPGLELLHGAPSFLGPLESLVLRFPVSAAFEDALPPDQTRVLNAGIVHDAGFTLRFEFESAGLDGTSAHDRRTAEWDSFFAGQYPSQLAGQDWAIEIPVGEFAANASRELDDAFSGPEIAKHFASSGPAWAVFYPEKPGFRFKKPGRVTCAGDDVNVDFLSYTNLSVPTANVLRSSVELDLDFDTWDVVKCTVLSILNPFSGIITTYDHGLPWFWAPVIPCLAPFAPLALGLGFDGIALHMAIDEFKKKALEKGKPFTVRTSDRTFYFDATKQITTSLTRDWVVVDQVAGAGDRLILRGRFTAPELTELPRLRGTLIKSFDTWSRGDLCDAGPWEVSAALQLNLENAADGRPVQRPDPPVRYGIDIESVDGKLVPVGGATWRVFDDPQGVYAGPHTRVYWGGVPGAYEVTVSEPPEPFASAPYPFRFQMFTSAGVREFEIPAPPAVPKLTPEEQFWEEAERINNCYIFTSLIHLIKALQVFWLPRPAEGGMPGQHWQVRIEGLESQDTIRVWNPDSGQLLAELTPLADGHVEVSLVFAAEHAVHSLQLTANDTAPMSMSVYTDLVASLGKLDKPGPHKVDIRQTPLYALKKVQLGHSQSDRLRLYRRNGRLSILVDGSRGGGIARRDLALPELRTIPVDEATDDLTVLQHRLPQRYLRLTRGERDGRPVTELLTTGLTDVEQVVNSSYVRPWYDGGDTTGDYFAQLDETGDSATLYLRGATQRVPPYIGRKDR
ncbi:hypothetical protein [Streptomyces canus]|uniref:hypothetical protein n=1 Tax=Streptomyces canus TaxID=58343 RepID=UPI0030E4201C